MAGMLNKKLLKALVVVRKNPGITSRDFARAMWPNSPGWQKPYKGKGGSVIYGKGMWLSAGSYLKKLSEQGFLDFEVVEQLNAHTAVFGYSLTAEGIAELKQQLVYYKENQ